MDARRGKVRRISLHHKIWLLIIIIFSLSNSYATPATPHQKHKPTRKITTTVSVKSKKKFIKKSPQKKIVSKTKHKNAHITIKHSARKHYTRKKKVHRAVRNPSTSIIKTNLIHSYLPAYSLSPRESKLVEFVKQTVNSVRYSSYRLGGVKFDPTRGVYIIDCSSYVDNILKQVYPQAYSSLVSWSKSEKPTTMNYYNYFKNLPNSNQNHWDSVEDVSELRPGDILVFRYKNSVGNETGGHIMVVIDKPQFTRGYFSVRVADSAGSGHSIDTRLPNSSGIGIGTLVLKVDPSTYAPKAYAWKEGYRWKNNVKIAMARPLPAKLTS